MFLFFPFPLPFPLPFFQGKVVGFQYLCLGLSRWLAPSASAGIGNSLAGGCGGKVAAPSWGSAPLSLIGVGLLHFTRRLFGTSRSGLFAFLIAADLTAVGDAARWPGPGTPIKICPWSWPHRQLGLLPLCCDFSPCAVHLLLSSAQSSLSSRESDVGKVGGSNSKCSAALELSVPVATASTRFHR